MNTHTSPRSFKPRACQKCGGDAFFDAGDAQEWRCLQCGKSMPSPSQPQQAEELVAASSARGSNWDGPGGGINAQHRVAHRSRLSN
jgi:hypothetical protein